MADNENQNQNQEQDPFDHPIKRNNWWLYILGGLCFAGIIIWFFIDWSYKNRVREPEQPQQTEQTVQPQQQADTSEVLPNVTVDATAPKDVK